MPGSWIAKLPSVCESKDNTQQKVQVLCRAKPKCSNCLLFKYEVTVSWLCRTPMIRRRRLPSFPQGTSLTLPLLRALLSEKHPGLGRFQQNSCRFLSALQNSLNQRCLPLSVMICLSIRLFSNTFSCHKPLKQCWYNVGPASQMLGQHYTNTDSTSHAYWDCSAGWTGWTPMKTDRFRLDQKLSITKSSGR